MSSESEKQEYINSLTIEELRAVVSEFWDWGDWENGCPRFQHPEYIWKHNQKLEKKDG